MSTQEMDQRIEDALLGGWYLDMGEAAQIVTTDSKLTEKLERFIKREYARGFLEVDGVEYMKFYPDNRVGFTFSGDGGFCKWKVVDGYLIFYKPLDDDLEYELAKVKVQFKSRNEVGLVRDETMYHRYVGVEKVMIRYLWSRMPASVEKVYEYEFAEADFTVLGEYDALYGMDKFEIVLKEGHQKGYGNDMSGQTLRFRLPLMKYENPDEDTVWMSGGMYNLYEYSPTLDLERKGALENCDIRRLEVDVKYGKEESYVYGTVCLYPDLDKGETECTLVRFEYEYYR